MINGTASDTVSRSFASKLHLKTLSRVALKRERLTRIPMESLSPPARRRHLFPKLLGLIALMMCGLAVSMAKPQMEPETPSEYEVKAAFLYSFAKFVEWPSEAFTDAHAPIILGVYGEDPFGDLLERTLEGRTANGRSFVVRRFKRLRDLHPCHILFVSSSEEENLPQIIASLKGLNVLSVGETEHFAELGGIINLTRENNRVRFEINLDSAQRARLKISSKLLTLAKIVRAGGGGGRD